MKKNKVSRSLEIEEFAEQINPSLLTSSTVSDNWLNQIKVYLKSDLTDRDVLFIFLNTYSMYLELLNARVADLISSEERQILIAKCISYFAYFEGLIGKKGKEIDIARNMLDFIVSQIQAFEEQNYRNKLIKILDGRD